MPYIVPVLLFFAMGLSALDGVATTFWVRDHIHLTASQLIEIGIWTQLPWSVKIAFGTVVDSFRFLGNNRRNYMLLGYLLMFLSQIGLWAFVSGYSPVSSEYCNLLVTGLVGTVGLVLAQSVANILAVETVEEKSIGKMQVAIRIGFSVGAVVAAATTGYLAAHYQLQDILWWKMLLPILLAAGTVVGLWGSSLGMEVPETQHKALAGVMLFLVYCLAVRSQFWIWAGQMIVINYLVWHLSRSMSIAAARAFLLTFLAIFLFRVSPDVGPSYSWWLIGSTTHGGLGFDEGTMGLLRMVSTAIDLGTLIALSAVMARGEVLRSLAWLTVIGALVSIPPILIYYGYTGGLSSRTLMLADTAVAGPLAELSMIPMGILIARAAPRQNLGMYMAVTASFMNMALVASDLISRQMNEIYVVGRDEFSHMGQLLLSTTAVGIVLSLVGLGILRYTSRRV